MKTQVCSQCRIEKPVGDYYKEIKLLTGIRRNCKDCCKKKVSEYQNANKEKIKARVAEYKKNNLEKVKEQKKAERQRNKDRYTANMKKWATENQEYIIAYRKKNYRENKKQHIEAARVRGIKRRNANPMVRVVNNLKRRTHLAITKGWLSKSTREYIGCSIPELKAHLELKFTNGMSWDNYSLKGWHVDHIKPLSSFDLSNEDERRIAFHYTNLQPLWAEENLRKAAKLNYVSTH